MKLNDFQLISVAGLLHDIGKVKQRAGYKVKNNYNESYCPTYKNGKLSYVHAAHTADFLDEFVKNFGIESDSDDKNLINIAAKHHLRGEIGALASIIRKADRLSSGFEREKSEDEGHYREDRLETIFSQVWLDDKKSDENKRPKTFFYPIKRLDFDVIPVEERKEVDKEAYKKIYDGFFNDLKKVHKNVPFDAFWDALEYLLEVYTWSVPSSSYFSYPRISLFDHMKTTAAIAQALYGFHKAGGTLEEGKIESIKDNQFLLVQGDFSGIQNFIFSKMGESNKFAAKILRARSFFVSLSTDLAAYDICKRLNLTKAAIVMNAGGKFTLLLPNTPESRKVLYRVEDEINESFRELTFGETRFYISSISLSDSDFDSRSDAFAKKMEMLAMELERKKLQPKIEKFVFDEYLNEVSKSEKGICKICGKHVAVEDKEVPICEHCRSFREIGTNLVRKRFLKITQDNGQNILNGYKLEFLPDVKEDKKLISFIKEALLVYDLKMDVDFKGVPKGKISGYVPVYTEEEAEIGRYDGLDRNEISDVGDPKTFAMIAEDAKEPNKEGEYVGEAFLGILKADVDNLGRIFIEGIKGDVDGKSGNSGGISKRVSLSRMLDFFFTGWLQNKLRTEEKYSSVYTVFSGGDDLFLIGPFSQIIDLAREINGHLKDYTKNGDFHLSCGISFLKPKIPVYQMAESVESILGDAKKIEGKNSIGIFGKVVKWHEFEDMMEDKDIKGILEQDDSKVSRGLKYSLFKFAEMSGFVGSDEKNKTYRDLLWKPLLIYQVYRNVHKELKEEALRVLVSSIEKYRDKFVIPLSNYVYRSRRK